MTASPAVADGGASRTTRHPVDEVLPAPKLAIYGFQHVLAFYAGAVIVPILLANSIGLSTEQLIHLINADLFTCGIASIIQSVGFWKVGVKLPLLQGVTFTAVSPMIAIGAAAGGGTDGLLVIYGAVIVAGLVTFFLAPYFSKLIRFFPPVVTGSVITIIGIALLPVAAADAAGGAGPTLAPTSGRNLAYALGTLALVVIIQRVFRGFMATVAVLAGLVIGTLVAWILGDAHFDSVGGSAWVGVTQPFFFGWPKFSAAAIISMIVVMLITAVETTGDVFATGEIVEKRITRENIARALRADGLATTIGGIFNSFPYTCFAENVGLVRLTRVKSRWVVATAGLIMIIIGLIPKAGAVVAGIPHPVLGGAALAMFATVAVVGFQTLSRVDFHDHRNVVIVATSVGLAMYVTAQPDVAKAVPGWAQIIFGSGITLGSITAILLNYVFHHVGKDFGPAVAGQPGNLVRLDQVNAMTSQQFVDTFASLFQGPRWVVERADEQRPFAETQDLRRAFQEALFSASDEQQRQLIASYPDLGADSVAQGASGPQSVADQAYLGLTRLGEEEHGELQALTAAYRAQFGFPLISCVRDEESFGQVVRHGWDRLNNSPTQEHAAALIEIAKIAGHRFDALVAEANPITPPARATWISAEMTTTNSGERLDKLNALPADDLRNRLASCLAVPRWVDEVAAGRPYADFGNLRERAAASAAELTDEELDAALARHPRIGERASAAHDGAHSRREQAAVDGADTHVAARLVAGNRAYEERFGRVFLVRAAGRSAAEILAELDRRLANDDAAERGETVAQLREIALLRLESVV